MTYETIDVRPLAGALGAEVLGVDLADDIGNRTFSEIQDAFAEHSVIFFRDQDLSPDQHLAFARRWGKINVNRYFPNVEGYPEIAEVRKEPEDKLNIGGGWHADHTYDQEPALGSILYARETPDHGGDTMFASMYRAYEGLSVGMRKLLDPMTAIHCAARAFGPQAEKYDKDLSSKFKLSETALKEVEQPVIATHPVTGRRALYVNRGFTVRFKDMTQEESQPLLNFLWDHAAKPEFTCRFRWHNGSIAFWDNRCAQHFAVNDYHGARRLMHRITIAGEAIT